MSGTAGAPPPATPAAGAPGAPHRAMAAVNRAVTLIGMIALVVAALVLTFSVVSRYVVRAATDWQDEVAVFCIVGAVFLSGAAVQARRGHIGIEAIAAILPDRVNRVRQAVVDVMSLAFCGFFAWKSWTLFHEAWVDHMTTSSTFSPPLTIPYGLMAVGMSLLVVQLLLQTVAPVEGAAENSARPDARLDAQPEAQPGAPPNAQQDALP